jgi:hypothetical protein
MRPLGVWVLIILHLLIGIGALISGTLLFVAPDGRLMMPLDVLKGSPFNDFLIPGIILFVFVGIIPVGVAPGVC